MRLPYHVVDAFTDRVFAGNPAAVLKLDRFLPNDLMQSIAAENNLSETAFVVAEGEDWNLRWFTPAIEVELCGHATLATAFVLDHLGIAAPWRFNTLSGKLTVTREQARFVLDFPAWPSRPAEAPAGLADALGAAPIEVHEARDWICVFPDAATVAALRPDHAKILALPGERVIATAAGGEGRGERVDITSRYFAIKAGIAEDPVTGSAHNQLVPFWASRLGRNDLVCRQASARGGMLWCSLSGDRVRLGGTGVLYAQGEIWLPD